MARVLWSLVLALSFSCRVFASANFSSHSQQIRLESRAVVSGPWSLVQRGTTGVSAMQLGVVSETKVLIYDKVEHNPLMVNGHVAWAVEFDLNTLAVRALNPLSNTWCATGSFLGNGTLVDTGGNPVVITGENGLQAIRFFTPCDNGSCDVIENPNRVRLTSNRWYPSSVRLQDGSIMIYGGSTAGGFINGAGVNNPTYEYYPPKNINGFNGVQIPSRFLVDTLNGNHYPNMVLLPSGDIFISANRAAMILNWRTNTETRLPGIPNNVRISSPFSAGHVLLPLTPPNYVPEVLICGGSTVSDTVSPSSFTAQVSTSNQCIRMALNAAGIAAGWQVETMPDGGRIMPELILLPDSRVAIVNGARTGVAGYGNVANRVGQSNADNPAFTPIIYDPSAPAGSRFSTSGLVASTIPRMYHSTASLTPDGNILLAGSNPNDDVTTTPYPTEYRVEFYSPPYMSRPRPSYTGLPTAINYGTTFTLQVTLPADTTSVTVTLQDLSFSTHGVHMDQRLVVLTSSLSSDRRSLSVQAPPLSTHYPPGPAFLFVVTGEGVPSFGHKTLVGTGASPPVNEAAMLNMLASTESGLDALILPPSPTEGEGSNIPTNVIEAPGN